MFAMMLYTFGVCFYCNCYLLGSPQRICDVWVLCFSSSHVISWFSWCEQADECTFKNYFDSRARFIYSVVKFFFCYTATTKLLHYFLAEQKNVNWCNFYKKKMFENYFEINILKNRFSFVNRMWKIKSWNYFTVNFIKNCKKYRYIPHFLDFSAVTTNNFVYLFLESMPKQYLN